MEDRFAAFRKAAQLQVGLANSPAEIEKVEDRSRKNWAIECQIRAQRAEVVAQYNSYCEPGSGPRLRQALF